MNIDKKFIEENLLTVKNKLNSALLKKHNVQIPHINLFMIYNELKNIPKCKACNNETIFVSFAKGFTTYCSYSCSANCKENNDNKKKTNLERYGVENVMQLSHNLRRREQTNLKKYGHIYYHQSDIGKQHLVNIGQYNSDADRTNWEIYKKRVAEHTNKNDLSILENIDKRGLCGIAGSYQLDHKYSVYAGFKNNILPYIIGNIENLEMLTWEENNKKRITCSITIEELFNKIYG